MLRSGCHFVFEGTLLCYSLSIREDSKQNSQSENSIHYKTLFILKLDRNMEHVFYFLKVKYWCRYISGDFEYKTTTNYVQCKLSHRKLQYQLLIIIVINIFYNASGAGKCNGRSHNIIHSSRPGEIWLLLFTIYSRLGNELACISMVNAMNQHNYCLYEITAFSFG